MYKYTINYEGFDGAQHSTTAYFNLSKTECVDLNLMYEDDGGLVGYIKKIMNDKMEDGTVRQKPALDFIKMLVEKSYGVRPADDPSLFLKEDDNGKPYIRKFRQSAAYDQFIYSILSGEIPLEEFAEKVLPAISGEQKAEAEKMLEKEGLGELVRKG